jgi:phosphonate transport system substrate-binding protein
VWGVPRWALGVAIALLPTVAGAGDPTPAPRGGGIEFGVTPFLPARMLVQNYQPMRHYLEEHLHEPVVFVTAPDFKSYFERVARHEYPFIMTVAHSAYLAHVESGYVPMLRPRVPTRPALVVVKDNGLVRLAELRGKTIALPDALGVIAMQARQMLREAGLDPARDVSLRYLPTHSAAVNYVSSGEVAAAIVSDRALQQMPAATRNAVRVVETWEPGALPGVVYLASPRLAPERVAQVREAILAFAHDTGDGRDLMTRLGYGDLVPATADDLKPIAPYAAMLNEALSGERAPHGE